MATVTEPIVLDKSINTTEQTPRNIADVLAEELARIAENILPPNAEDIAYDNSESGLTATNVQDAIDEVISSHADVIADTMADLTENKTATVTDGVADFETIDGSLVKSLVVEIEPSQSGSGTPSPDNIRPISGYTEEVISVKDSTDTTQATYTTPFGQTVYGGTLDVLTGELTITHGYVDLGSLTWNQASTSTSGKNRFTASITPSPKPSPTNTSVPDLTCSHYETVSPSNTYNCIDGITVTTAGTIAIYDDTLATVSSSDFKTAMNGVQLAYELETPTTLSLTPQKVKSLVGENHISASTGDVLECKFSMLINGDDLAQIIGG